MGISLLQENQILILSKHLISSITTIEQSLHKQLTSHCEVLLKIGVPEKQAEPLEIVCEGVHFLVKLQACMACGFAGSEPLRGYFQGFC